MKAQNKIETSSPAGYISNGLLHICAKQDGQILMQQPMLPNTGYIMWQSMTSKVGHIMQQTMKQQLDI